MIRELKMPFITKPVSKPANLSPSLSPGDSISINNLFFVIFWRKSSLIFFLFSLLNLLIFKPAAVDAGVPPLGPAGLAATGVSSNQINLSWQLNMTNANGLVIMRKQGVSGIYKEIYNGIPIQNYSDKNIPVIGSYYYYVFTYNAFGFSSYSNEANATTSAIFPDAPSGLTAVQEASPLFTPIPLIEEETSNKRTFEILIEDNLVSLNSKDAEIADVLREIQKLTGIKISIDELLKGKKITNNFWKLNLENALRKILDGYMYHFTYSLNKIDENIKNLKYVYASGFPLPDSSNYQAVQAFIDLKWTDNSNNESGFILERKKGKDGAYEKIAQIVENFTHTTDAVDNNMTYYYRIASFNQNGQSAYSNEISSQATKIEVSPAPGPKQLNLFPGLTAMQIGYSSFVYYNSELSNLLNLKLGREGFEIIRAIETKIDSSRADRYTIDFDFGPSDDPAFIIYLQTKEGLIKAGSIGGQELVVPGNGYIYVSGSSNDYFNRRRKYVIEEMKLKEVTQPFYYVGLRSTNTKPLDLYKDLTYQEKIAHLPENSELEVLIARLRQSEHEYALDYDFLIKTPFGLLGWVHLGNIKGIYFHGD